MAQEIDQMATLNLWELNFWDERRDLVIEMLKKAGFENKKKVVLGLQEVRITNINPLQEIAERLGFEQRHVYFFPTVLSQNFGLAFITNLDTVVRKETRMFRRTLGNPSDFGYRGIGLLDVELQQGPTTLGITHFSVESNDYMSEGVECLDEVRNFILERPEFSQQQREEFKHKPLKELCSHENILLAGDFNADPTTTLYDMYDQSGLTEYTKNAREEHPFTWPSDVEWFLQLHRKTWHAIPPYPIHQRWIDYIWGCGFTPKQTYVYGDKKKDDMFPTDHLMPVVVF